MKIINKEISVLAAHKKGESMAVPLRFQYENIEGERQTVNIDKLSNWSEEKIAGNRIRRYICQSYIERKDSIIVYEIRYDVELEVWYLYKI